MASKADKLRGDIKKTLENLDRCNKAVINGHKHTCDLLQQLGVRIMKLESEPDRKHIHLAEASKQQSNIKNSRQRMKGSVSAWYKALTDAEMIQGDLTQLLLKKEKKKLFYRKTHPKIVKSEKALDKAIVQSRSTMKTFYTRYM